MKKKKDANTSKGKEELKKELKKKNSALERLKKQSKAEAKQHARAIQVETALEKVRATTMAMQKADELNEVIKLIYEQLAQLEFQMDSAGFVVDYKESNDLNAWVCRKGQLYPGLIRIPYFDHPIFTLFIEAKAKELDFYAVNLTKEEKDALYRHIFHFLPNWTEERKAMLYNLPGYADSHVLMKKVMFYIQNFTGFPYTESENEVLMRFGKVFEQTYTRFLDLQKAEAQAREAQIEVALEKVRSRSLAMQKSQELKEVVTRLFEGLDGLSFEASVCNVSLINSQTKATDIWSAHRTERGLFSYHVFVPYLDGPIYNGLLDAFSRQQAFSVHELSVELKKNSNKIFFENVDYSKAPEAVRHANEQFRDNDQPSFISAASMKYGLISVSRSTLLSTAEAEVIKRFARVFEQCYTRFLDLQKAEAQAREAQIEAALERVRSRTMAMQKAEELNDVIKSIYDQLVHLGFDMASAGFVMDYKETNDLNAWIWREGQEYSSLLHVPYFEHPMFISYTAAKAQGLDFYSARLTKEEKDTLYRHVFEYVPGWTEERKRLLYDTPGFAISNAMTKNVLLYVQNFTGIPYTDAENAVLLRFGKVFEQTHTRFLDLQKAETQAREAQIEAALERVRSRSMGMLKSEELKEVIQVVYEQFVNLNMLVEHTGFIMDYKQRNDMHIWLADKHEVPSEITIPYFDSPHWNSFNEAKEKGINFFANLLNFEEKNKFYQDLFQLIPGVPDETKSYYLSCPALAGSTVLLENIGLYIENFSGIPYSDEENNTLMRFGKVFQQTYTRFLDLKKVEAQTLEAIRRASVDRVRGEIASMRTTKDLERITPLIWNELKTLGVPFVRCGVFIMDEDLYQIHTYLSTPEGRSIATLHVPFDFDLPLTRNGLEHWRDKKVYQEHWDAATFTKNWEALAVLHESYINSSPNEQLPDNLHLHLLPFLQGMLYVGSESPLTPVSMQLSQALADAFSAAYARYEDFNKLEGAKKQVESTLSELQSTQKQLIQSEKMASLGELTAGIAHEIQNPLNFVNNFSEVNTELVLELEIELKSGRTDEAFTILNDIKENEEKINHHGKRADAIVKGMLQHSRSSAGQKEPNEINALADEYLRLSYHGLRAKENTFNAELKTDFDNTIGSINIIAQDIGRVLLNLYNNAFYAVDEKSKQGVEGYKPSVSVITSKNNDRVEIRVMDNGNGIPGKVVDKIFQPFFTTKPTGKGTGLGLSLSYDIIKAHGGEIRVETNEGVGTAFIVQLPV
jgi:signal transduction histidine kinase